MTIPVSESGTLWPALDGLAQIIEKSRDHQDRRGYFAALYYWVSRGIGALTDPASPQHFDNPKQAAAVLRGFYQRYFDAYDAVSFGREPSRPWKLAYDAAATDGCCVLQHLLAAMSAHIVFDLAIALSETLSPDELDSFRGDFEKCNQVFADLLPGVIEGLAEINPALKPLLALEHLGLLRLLQELLAHLRDVSWSVATLRARSRRLGRVVSDETAELACIGVEEVILGGATPLRPLFEALRWHESSDTGKNIALLFQALGASAGDPGAKPQRPPKRRVVIVGGGIGGLATAFYLTDPRNPTSRNCEVTIYQLGWRAGGKGTTGRSSDPQHGNRIQEHGLHAFFGFYENAFRLVHDAYAALPPGNPIPTWREAFEPINAGVYWEPVGAAKTPWRIDNPPDNVMPGAGGIEGPPSMMPSAHELGMRALETIDTQLQILAKDPNDPLHTIASGIDPLIKSLIGLFGSRSDKAQDTADLDEHRQTLRTHLESMASGLLRHIGLSWAAPAPPPRIVPLPPTGLFDRLHTIGREARDEVAKVLQFRMLATGVHDALDRAAAAVDARSQPTLVDDVLAGAIRAFQQDAFKLLEPAFAASDSARRLWIMLNLGMGVIRGLVADNALVRGLTALNDHDFREWVSSYIVDDGGITLNSAVMHAIYDASFAYVDGDMASHGETFPPNARFEAGTAIAGALRAFLTYRGAFGFKMVAGTGDSVVAPLCRVLKNRGVRFRYFRVVRDVKLEPGTGRVAQLDVEPQAKVIAESKGGEYDPFITVKGLSCWPDHPRYEQLENGNALSGIDLEDPGAQWPKLPMEHLLVDRDFDEVVLAVPPAALAGLSGELSTDPEWVAMLGAIKSVRTEAMQNWLYKTPEDLGLNPLAAQGRPVTVSWNDRGNDLNVMSDYRKALEWETWPAGNEPEAVIYHCSVMREDATLGDVKALGRQFLERDGAAVYGAFDWSLLVAPPGSPADATRFEAQFQRANTTPSERYVLSVPGSSAFRLPAHRSVVPNLYLAGDWVRTALNCGCMEATVMSGMLASNALSAWPPLDLVVGNDFGRGLADVCAAAEEVQSK